MKDKRYTGTPYVVHPTATAVRLAEMKLPIEVVVAGLLHDVPEDTAYTLEEVRRRVWRRRGGHGAWCDQVGKVKYRGIERYAENLRRMFLAMAEDVRVVFIKFADRLHNVRPSLLGRRVNKNGSPRRCWKSMRPLPRDWAWEK